MILSLFRQLVSVILITLSSLMIFSAGSVVLMQTRDFDASIGLIEKPKEAFSSIAKFFGGIEAEAQLANAPNQIAQIQKIDVLIAEGQIEKALNQLLRNLVLQFIQGILDFLVQQFDRLLSLVEQWANSVLGIRLNLAHIRRFVALKAYNLYNQIEGSVNNVFNGLFGPVNDIDPGVGEILEESFGEALATAEIAHATNVAAAPVGGVGSNVGSMIGEISDSVSDINQVACEERIAVLGSGSEDGPGRYIYPVSGFLTRTCPEITTALAEFGTRTTQRLQEIEELVEESTDNQNLFKGSPNSCAPVIREISDNELQEANSLVNVIDNGDFGFSEGGNLFNLDTSNNSVLTETANITSNSVVLGLSESDCDLANEAKQQHIALSESNASKEAPETESLMDVIWQTLQEFMVEIFNKLADIITQFIQSAIQKVIGAINGIGNRLISGPLSNALNQVNSSLTDLIRNKINEARDSLINNIR